MSLADEKEAETFKTMEDGKECVELISDCSINSSKPHWSNCRRYLKCESTNDGIMWIVNNCENDEIYDRHEKKCLPFQKTICFIEEKEFCSRSKEIFFSRNRNQSLLFSRKQLSELYKPPITKTEISLPIIICITVIPGIIILVCGGVIIYKRREAPNSENRNQSPVQLRNRISHIELRNFQENNRDSFG